MKTKISIITVCRNSAATIGRTIESVINQNYEALEYIIIDGASTDGTIDIVKDKLIDCSFETRIISEPDRGIYDAMNKGLKLAGGDLICMLNSDDWLTENALEIVSKEYEKTEKKDYLVLYGMERRLRDGREKECFLYGHEFIPERNLAHQACYITKKTYDRFGGYDIQYKSAADHDMILRLFMSREVVFVPVYHVLVNFAEGGISSSCYANIEGAKVRKKHRTIKTREYIYTVFRACFLKLIGKMQ